MESWYAVFVITGQEARVKERLDNLFEGRVEFLVPRRKLKERRAGVWRDVFRTVYPGYVLARGEILPTDAGRINVTTGVIRLLADEHGPQKILEHDIGLLVKMLNSEGVIDYSTAFVRDSKVVITQGPLVSMEGIVQNFDVRKGRVKVRLVFFGEERIVDLGVTLVNSAMEVK
ncbi:MAG: antiterminator LoaP [Bacillota bacterium]